MIQDPILLVDDEDDLRTFLRDALTQDEYRVDDAPDANTALAMMAARHYPVVLTDLNMPGGPTGFDLITAVKARDPRTLCIVITGYASMETAVRALKFGAYDFVQKPFKLAEIEAVLDRALNHATLMGQLQDYQNDLETRVLARVREIQELYDETQRLNDLLVDAQGQVSEAPIFTAFLDHLRAHIHPAGDLALLPGPGDGWTLLARTGTRCVAVPDLPPPSNLSCGLEWAGPAGYPDGHLIPLFGGGILLGAIYLGFDGRSSFHPEQPAFHVWRRQLEAALHGLHRTRALVAEEAAKARPE